MSADQIIYAFGSGRDPQTKMARRMDRFGERTFRIGADVVIRAGRRIPVSVKYLAAHLEEVVGHVERGALRLQSDSDRYIDPMELRAIVRGETPPAPVKATEVYEEEPEPEVLPDPPEEIVAEPTESETLDDSPAPTEAPFTETPSEVETEVSFSPLPEGWRTQSKRVLLQLALERNLEASDKMSNRELAAVLTAYENGRG